MTALDDERAAHQVCVEMRDAAYREIGRLRAAASIGLDWMCDLEHMGSVVDQEALAADLAKVTAALGWVRAVEQ